MKGGEATETPSTSCDVAVAMSLAERLRLCICRRTFRVPQNFAFCDLPYDVNAIPAEP